MHAQNKIHKTSRGEAVVHDRRVLATQRLLWGAQNALRSLAHLHTLYGGTYTRDPLCKGELLAIAVALAKANKIACELRTARADSTNTKYLQSEVIYTSVANADADELQLRDDEAMWALCDCGDVVPLENILLAGHYTQTHREAVFCGQASMWYSVAEHRNLASIATGCTLADLQDLEASEGARDWREFTCHLHYFCKGEFADAVAAATTREFADAELEISIRRDASEITYILDCDICDITNGVCRALQTAGKQQHKRDFCLWLERLGYVFAEVL